MVWSNILFKLTFFLLVWSLKLWCDLTFVVKLGFIHTVWVWSHYLGVIENQYGVIITHVFSWWTTNPTWWWCLLFVLAETKISPKLYTQRVLPTIRGCLEGLALMVWKSRMVLASPGLLLTPPPSSSPPKTPHLSYSAKIRSQNEEKTTPPPNHTCPYRRELDKNFILCEYCFGFMSCISFHTKHKHFVPWAWYFIPSGRINIGADVWGKSSIVTCVYHRWCSSTLHIRWGLW